MYALSNLGCCTNSLNSNKPTQFEKTLRVAILITTLITSLFIALAIVGQFTVISALLASFCGIIDLIFIAYYCLERTEARPKVIQRPKVSIIVPKKDSPPQQITEEQNISSENSSDRTESSEEGRAMASSENTPDHTENSEEAKVVPNDSLVADQKLLEDTKRAQEWQDRLELHSYDRSRLYNIHSDEPIAPSSIWGQSVPALPAFGNYDNHYQYLTVAPAFGVRLPPSQLPGFPPAIQEMFKNAPDVEIYFLVYEELIDPSTIRNLRR